VIDSDSWQTGQSMAVEPTAVSDDVMRARGNNKSWFTRHAIAAGLRVGANFAHSNFARADLLGVNLRGANLEYANCNDANLTNADLRNTCLEVAQFERTDLSGSDLRNAYVGDHPFALGATFKDARCYTANFANSKLITTAFDGAMLFAANFDGACLNYSGFSHANCSSASLFGICIVSWCKSDRYAARGSNHARRKN